MGGGSRRSKGGVRFFGRRVSPRGWVVFGVLLFAWTVTPGVLQVYFGVDVDAALERAALASCPVELAVFSLGGLLAVGRLGRRRWLSRLREEAAFALPMTMGIM